MVGRKKKLMKEHKRIGVVLFLNLVALLLLGLSVQAHARNKSFFEYVAGTESMPKGCEGKLEVTEAALIFQCAQGSITVPYASIIRMEYRQRVSKEIRKMKLNWVVEPPSSRSKHQGYFTVLYGKKEQAHAMILKVSTDTMRPYLAEIDLKTGLPINSVQD